VPRRIETIEVLKLSVEKSGRNWSFVFFAVSLLLSILGTLTFSSLQAVGAGSPRTAILLFGPAVVFFITAIMRWWKYLDETREERRAVRELAEFLNPKNPVHIQITDWIRQELLKLAEKVAADRNALPEFDKLFDHAWTLGLAGNEKRSEIYAWCLRTGEIQKQEKER